MSLEEYSERKSRRILKRLAKRMLITIIIDIFLIIVVTVILMIVGISIFNFMTAGVVQVSTNIIEEVSLSDDRHIKIPRTGENCPCKDCIILTSGTAYTTGNITGNSFHAEVLRLAEALAKDTNSFVWMPYAKSAVEYSGALVKPDSIYTNYSSIYTNYTDKLDKKDRWGSIGLIQITGSNADADTFSKALTDNVERFKRAVQLASGDLSGYTTIVDQHADTIYEDRLYLPAQIGTVFYYYESVKNEYIKLANNHIPGFGSMSEIEQEVVLEMIYLASWNNGTSGTRKALENSDGGKLGQYIADLAKLYVDDNHFRQLINLEGVAYLGGNNYTKVVENVLKYMGKDTSEYINSTEVNGNVNDWTSRTYCYATNGLLGGSYIFKQMLESNGGNVTGSLAKLGVQSASSIGAVNFEDVKLTYSAESVDGVIQKEYDTIYGPLDYHVDLLPIGDDYNSGGSSDLPPRKLDKVSGIVIHYTGGGVGGTAEAIRKWFDEPYNKDTGTGTYTSSHFAIGVDGKIIQMAPLDNETIASNGANSHTISIEVNYESVNGAYGSKAYNSLLHLTAWLAVEFNIDTDTRFIKADKSLDNVLYRDIGAIQRHYDVDEYVNYGSGKVQRAKACPLYWVPNDNSADEGGTTNGGNSRWISFKKDLTSFILTYKGDANFAPSVEIPGLAEAKELSKGNPVPNWKSGATVKSGVQWGCSCGTPCEYCDCHNGTGSDIGYTGELTGRAKNTDFGYGSFKGTTWASSQFLDNAKTVIKAMIDSGYGYDQTLFHDPFGDFYGIRYDCSGYVSAVLNYSGYTQFKNNTSRNFDADWDSYYPGWKRIYDINELEPGDIMVMEAGGRSNVKGQIGHVEIYAGNKSVYNVGSDDYLINHPNGNPDDATNKWRDRENRFLFAWRITKPNN